MVTMASKLTFSNNVADWQERINVSRLREERAARARQIMRKHGIAMLLASGEPNVRYLTGLRAPASYDTQLQYVLFFAEHEPVVFEHAGFYQQMPEECPWIKNWRLGRSWLAGVCGPEASKEEAELFAAGIYDEIKEKGLTGEKLGIVGIDAMGVAALEKLKLNCFPARHVIMEARTIKTKDEINCFKMVAAIVDSTCYRIWEALKPGIRDTELDLVIAKALVETGADVLKSPWKLSGPGTFERGLINTGRLIQMGDLFYVALCGITFLGYKSCFYRTFKVGRKPTEKENDWYKKVLDRVDNVIYAIKPGNTTADAARHLVPASSWGYKDEAEVLTVEIGHGLALGAGYDPPIINRQWSLKHPQAFEPGMVMAVECLEGEHRVGGVRLENMIVITETGAEIIDHMTRDEILIAPR